PHDYLKKVRFFNLLNSLKKNNNTEISNIIYDLNFYDYSHFIKEFKKIVGETPQNYINGYWSGDHSVEKFFSHD
ncbi:MAG: AraC family transcriptional regulator, partial [Bacteroidales bacterium]|nr:AraC family transcriptional regulator [Bacteroidales bacterium]